MIVRVPDIFHESDPMIKLFLNILNYKTYLDFATIINGSGFSTKIAFFLKK
jgi:hypothetical protein